MSDQPELPAFMEGRPTYGYLRHSVPSSGAFIHRPSKYLAITYRQSLCGTGRSGLRLLLDDEANPKAWVGVDGCERCHNAYNRLMKEATA